MSLTCSWRRGWCFYPQLALRYTFLTYSLPIIYSSPIILNFDSIFKTMETTENSTITVATTVKAPVEKVWQYWTTPEHITRWNNASDDWHTPSAENDLRVGGKFNYRMEATDGSFGFDFGATYDEIQPNERLAYTLDDGRKVSVTFNGNETETTVTEIFAPENTHPAEMQQTGWQAILDNFKKYTETN